MALAVRSKVTGGDRLKAALGRIARGLERARSVEVGFMAGATYPDGTSVPLVAAFNEFGVPSHGQPPRPFMRNAVAARKDAWKKNLGTALKQTNYDAAAALDMVGEGIADDIRESILSLTSPPLAPSTIAAKGFEKPLVDTGQMLNSVTHVVKKG